MSRSRVPAALRRLVRERAAGACEYCRTPEWISVASFHVDHIVATKHGGGTEAGNLAFACPLCNAHKGTDLTTHDPTSGEAVSIFHPSTHRWADHFRVVAGRIEARSAIGDATVRLLQLNAPTRIEERQRWRKLQSGVGRGQM